MVFYECQTLVSLLSKDITDDRGESGIGNWTVHVMDVESGFVGHWDSWQLILWGSSIDATIAKPHPLPGSSEDPTSTDILPLPKPTISPPSGEEEETPVTPSPTPSETTTPQQSFWPWSGGGKAWLYGSIALIGIFVAAVAGWYGVQRHKARVLETHGRGREDYEFEMLPNEGDEHPGVRRAGELYDAFAGGEEYWKNDAMESEFGKGEALDQEEIGDPEMGAFLGGSDDEEEHNDDSKLLRKDKA